MNAAAGLAAPPRSRYQPTSLDALSSQELPRAQQVSFPLARSDAGNDLVPAEEHGDRWVHSGINLALQRCEQESLDGLRGLFGERDDPRRPRVNRGEHAACPRGREPSRFLDRTLGEG